jgi:signal transduction histidine kinase
VVVRGDRALLRRMLRNLIENAERHGAPPVEVLIGRDGTQAVVTVSDHGPGVAASEREPVFSPFSRVAGRNAGTGLGLTLVRQIARQHQGDAAWAGTPQSPSTLRVVLPALSKP